MVSWARRSSRSAAARAESGRARGPGRPPPHRRDRAIMRELARGRPRLPGMLD